MNTSDPYGFATLEDLSGLKASVPDHDDPVEKDDDREKFPCTYCAGSGRWSRGRNRHGESKCFNCNGRGYFLTSERDRRRARQQRRDSKARRLTEAQEAFNEAEPGLIDALRQHIEWNDFAKSLVERFDSRGDLSDKQIAAARRMLAKIEQGRKERAAETDARSTEVDLNAIRAMFEHAMETGLKKPTYRAEGLVISRAPDHGRNAGALYVKTAGGDYQGKITPDNVFRPWRETEPNVAEALQVIATNPEEAAVRYGRLTGSCACCGRELTNPESVERGIGPICANKFGF